MPKVDSLPETHVVAEFVRERRDDGYWVGFRVRGGSHDNMVGPFDTREEADRALDDLTKTALSLGGVQLPGGPAN